MSARIIVADVLDGLAALEPESVQCVVTSPPYWGLRDYGVAGQIGLEATPRDYLRAMVRVFGAVRRVLRKDGTLWLNLGDCYATGAGKVGKCPGGGEQGARWRGDVDRVRDDRRAYRVGENTVDPKSRNGLGPLVQPNRMPISGLKPKDLVGMPWRVALALQRRRWWLRSDIVWSKPNPMPESVKDRPTRSHEYLFLMTRSRRYYYDADAIAEPVVRTWDETNGGSWAHKERFPAESAQGNHSGPYPLPRQRQNWPAGWARGDEPRTAVEFSGEVGRAPRRNGVERIAGVPDGRERLEVNREAAESSFVRNKRTVWEVATQPYPEAHFATFPEALVEPCILAGSRRGDLVLDPFAGSGTVGLVAGRLGRHFVGVELNPAYAELARRRIHDDCPLFESPTVDALIVTRKDS